MNLFKTFTLTWWQTSILKISLLAAGIAIGAYWSDIFYSYITWLIVIALVAGIYVTYVWAKQ